MSPRNEDQHENEGELGVVTEKKTKRPRLYKVLLHNDHYTTMEFVVLILKEVFHKSESDSVTIMLHVHRSGVGVAGVYSREIAETRQQKAMALAREAEYPLLVTVEPEEIDGGE
jgi:ATP-dependent Clp protease adaptor protein ClpS